MLSIGISHIAEQPIRNFVMAIKGNIDSATMLTSKQVTLLYGRCQLTPILAAIGSVFHALIIALSGQLNNVYII